MDKKTVCDVLDAKKEQFFSASDTIWETPELRFATKKSVQQHYQLLEKEGFAIQKGIPNMKHAYIATYGSGKPVIGVLAEYDALSNLSQIADVPQQVPLTENGNGHGCGHNLLGIGALIGAVGIKDYLQETKVSGTIKLFGCPAEEGGCGKTYMVRDGLFDDVDIALTWHPGDTTSTQGSKSLAVYHVFYKFKGVATHAAAAPEMGRSALDAAELMNIGVQYLREHIADQARIHYAYWDAGGKSPNVVQSSTNLFYYVRAPRMNQATEIYKRVNQIAEGAALMTDTTLEIEFDSACSDFIPNPTVSQIMQKNLEYLMPINLSKDELAYEQRYFETVSLENKQKILEKAIIAFPDKTGAEIQEIAKAPFNPQLYPLVFSNEAYGSTDVGDVSWVVPTAQVNVACEPHGTPAHSWQWVAHGKSSVAHKGMMVAGKAIALSGIDILANPQLVETAKSELYVSVGRDGYTCPMPIDVMPDE